MDYKYAYVTILSTEGYLDGVGALMLSLRKTRTQIPFYVLCGPAIETDTVERLKRIGYAQVLRYDKSVTVPDNILQANTNRQNSNWNFTFDKLLVFELTQFDKIVFIDADMMVTQNLDRLFALPHMSATNAGCSFPGNENDIDLNSGLMVLEPQPGVVEKMLATVPSILDRKKAFGDQDVLQAYYSDWASRSELNFGEKYNVYANYLDYYLKQLHYCFSDDVNDPRSIAVVHFIGSSKPWHARWTWYSSAFQELRFCCLCLLGIRNTQWALLKYRHLIRLFRRQYNHRSIA